MTRQIRGLKWARALDVRPKTIPIGRPRGAKAAGIRYERELGMYLGEFWIHGPWFEFEDVNGAGYCQPDFIRMSNAGIDVLECKYTWTMEAYKQLEGLYCPVLGMIYHLPIRAVQVCKNLIPESALNSGIDSNLEAALSSNTILRSWHWLGTGLRPQRAPARTRRKSKLSPAQIGL